MSEIPELSDKTNWYDGRFYAAMYKYLGGEPFDEAVMSFIEPISSVVDIGCGPGMLLFSLARNKRCARGVGVDLSSKMIDYANQEKERQWLKKIDFIHLNAANLSDKLQRRFDYAVASFVLHELPHKVRHNVVEEMKAVANSLIIAEYSTTQPLAMRLLNWLAESSAGRKHLQHYKNYLANGGTGGLLEKHGLSAQRQITLYGTYEIVMAAPSG